MKAFIVLLTFGGIMAIVIGYINSIKSCPEPKIEYRYIPRTFEEEQNDPVKASKLFKTMFDDPSPWVGERQIGTTRPSAFSLNELK
jgi:hypothetical protein